MSCSRGHTLMGRLSMTLAAATVLGALLVNPCLAQNNLTYQGGPVQQNTIRVFMIYWLPSGVVLDTAAADGVGNFVSLHQRFFGDISGSLYANILLQYPGKCGTKNCVLQNGPGAFAPGGSFVDSLSYPRQPLQDSDIQDEIVRAIAINHWTADENSIFFVTTGVFKSSGAPVMECSGSGCTRPGGFCAYHTNFKINGRTVTYGYLSDGAFSIGGGCNEGLAVAAPNGQRASDIQIALMSHELYETVTDPLIDAWYDKLTQKEISDNCNQVGSVVNMNGNNYWVQQQWSNASTSCVSAVDRRTACLTSCQNADRQCPVDCKADRDDCFRADPGSKLCATEFIRCNAGCPNQLKSCNLGCAVAPSPSPTPVPTPLPTTTPPPPPPPPPPGCQQACQAVDRECLAGCRSERDACFEDDPGSQLCVSAFKTCNTGCANQLKKCTSKCK